MYIYCIVNLIHSFVPSYECVFVIKPLMSKIVSIFYCYLHFVVILYMFPFQIEAFYELMDSQDIKEWHRKHNTFAFHIIIFCKIFREKENCKKMKCIAKIDDVMVSLLFISRFSGFFVYGFVFLSEIRLFIKCFICICSTVNEDLVFFCQNIT